MHVITPPLPVLSLPIQHSASGVHTPPIAVPLRVWSEAFSAAPCICTHVLSRCVAAPHCSWLGDPFSSTVYMCSPVRSPSVASQHGALSCPVGGLFSIALSLCLPLSRRHIVPGRGPFRQCLQYVLASPAPSCDIMPYSRLPPLNALSASSFLGRLKEPQLQNSRHWSVGREATMGAPRDTLADMQVGKWVVEAPPPQRDAVGRGHRFDAPGCRCGCDMKVPNDDWDSRAWPSSFLGRVQHGVTNSESMWNHGKQGQISQDGTRETGHAGGGCR